MGDQNCSDKIVLQLVKPSDTAQSDARRARMYQSLLLVETELCCIYQLSVD